MTDSAGQLFCEAEPDRRLYAADGQTVSGVAICPHGLDDVYVVSGEKRPGPGGASTHLVRAYWNPWVRFIFAGPLIMALGGLLSLTDRRLRFAITAKVRGAALPAAAE